MRRLFNAALAVGMIAALALPAQAADIRVLVTNLGSTGAELVFEPALNRVDLGDSVTFIPADKSINVESIFAMVPDGAIPLRGEPGEKLVVTFNVAGIYGFKSASQYGKGMVGMVIAGDVDPQTADTRHNPRAARERFEAMLGSLQ